MRTKEETFEEAKDLLLKLEVFDCDAIYCSKCPFDTNKKRGAPNPSPNCYPVQARQQREWLRGSTEKSEVVEG